MKYPFASHLIAQLAPSMGITVELEPEFQFAGELIFPNGTRHLFRNTNFNVNPAGSTEIARDKAYTNYFLHKHGFHVPRCKTFFAARLNANLAADRRRGAPEALAYAAALGYPVYVKPNNLSQGSLVTKAYGPADVTAAAAAILARTDVLVVEAPCPGRDYRIVVLADRIISAYERLPLSITGDGCLSIDALLQRSQNALEHLGRPNSEINPADTRIDIRLRELGLTRAYVPPVGERIVLLDIANLSTGGTSVDVTATVHPSFAGLAIRATEVLGLRLSGVDILCEDLTANAHSQVWNIIEVNAAPGLDNYSSMGEEQAKRVRDLYRAILEYLTMHAP